MLTVSCNVSAAGAQVPGRQEHPSSHLEYQGRRGGKCLHTGPDTTAQQTLIQWIRQALIPTSKFLTHTIEVLNCFLVKEYQNHLSFEGQSMVW